MVTAVRKRRMMARVWATVLLAGGAIALGALLPGWWAASLGVLAGAIAAVAFVRAGMDRPRDVEAAARVGLQNVESLLAPLATGERAAESEGGDLERLGRVARSISARIGELETALARVGAVVEAVDDAVLAIDESGRVALCNEAGARVIGLPVERTIGRGVEEVFTRPELNELYAEARDGRPGRREVRFQLADGARTYVASAEGVGRTPGDAGARRPVVMTLRDVTESSRALRVRTDFVANASHELRTPIASIRAAVETYERAGDGAGTLAPRLFRIVGANALRLEEMVRDLSDLSRLESPDLRPHLREVDAVALVEQLRTVFEHACASRGLTLQVDIEPALRRLRTDASLLTMILQNLVDNAMKFAYEGTTVRVVGRAAAGEGPWRDARFDVVDEGIGIPLDEQQRIFERYYQVDQARSGGDAKRGTGLGLSIVKHAARRLGGSVRVSSIWKRGTTMSVDLPACVPPDAEAAAPVP